MTLSDTSFHITQIFGEMLGKNTDLSLKVQSCNLCSNKYMIPSTQITSAKIFAFTAVLVFKLLSRKVLFINRKGNRKFAAF